jgi:hypothetical protein
MEVMSTNQGLSDDRAAAVKEVSLVQEVLVLVDLLLLVLEKPI